MSYQRNTSKNDDRLHTRIRIRPRWRRSNRRCNNRSVRQRRRRLGVFIESVFSTAPGGLASLVFALGGLASFAAFAALARGLSGRCEPEAVAPELAPDPASLGGELGSVDDAADPEEPRALFSFCRCLLRSAFSWSVSGFRFICLARPGVKTVALTVKRSGT